MALHPYRMGEGDALKTYARSEDWQPIPDGSAAALLAEVACSDKKPGAQKKK